MRRTAAVGSFIVAALLALAAPASAQTLPVCAYQPPAPEPTQAEKELAELKGYAASASSSASAATSRTCAS